MGELVRQQPIRMDCPSCDSKILTVRTHNNEYRPGFEWKCDCGAKGVISKDGKPEIKV